MYASPEDAKVFLGVLDAVFMFSYAAVSKLRSTIKSRFRLSLGSIHKWYSW